MRRTGGGAVSTLLVILAHSSRVSLSLLLMVSLTVATSRAQADDIDNPLGSMPSGRGNVLFLSTGVLLPLIEDGHAGKAHSIQTATALATSSVFALGLKNMFREKRPNTNSRDSFPSGHSAAAFAVATVQSSYHPRQAWLWYGGASIIASNRVMLHEHYIHDVLAGAALGYLTARLELSHHRGILLTPFADHDSSAVGLSLHRSF